MGYGKQAMKILQNYFEGKIPNLDENATEPEVKTVQTEVSNNDLEIHTEYN